MVSGATLVDLVEASPVKPFDTIKVCYRLCELGLVARRDPVRPISPLTAQVAVRDWLLGTASPEPRSTVTEAGRRAAEAYADNAANRADDRNESDDLFGDETVRQEKLEAEPEVPESPAVARTLPEQRFDSFGDLKTDTEHTQLQPPAEPKVVVAPQREVVATAPGVERKQPAPHTFDELDEAFFAEEEELHRVAAVESFDDLDESKGTKKLQPKKKWGLFGGTKPGKPAAKPSAGKPRSSKKR